MTHAQEAGGAYPANEQIESFTHQEVPPRPGPLSSVQYHNNSLWRKHGRFPRLRVSDYARRSALNARTQALPGSPGKPRSKPDHPASERRVFFPVCQCWSLQLLKLLCATSCNLHSIPFGAYAQTHQPVRPHTPVASQIRSA